MVRCSVVVAPTVPYEFKRTSAGRNFTPMQHYDNPGVIGACFTEIMRIACPEGENRKIELWGELSALTIPSR